MSLPFYLLPLHEQINRVNTQLYNIRAENQKFTEKEIEVENRPMNDADYNDTMDYLSEAEKRMTEATNALVRLSTIPYYDGLIWKVATVSQISELLNGSAMLLYHITALENILRNLQVYKTYLNIANTKKLYNKYDIFWNEALSKYDLAYYDTVRPDDLKITGWPAGGAGVYPSMIKKNYDQSFAIAQQYKGLLDYARGRPDRG